MDTGVLLDGWERPVVQMIIGLWLGQKGGEAKGVLTVAGVLGGSQLTPAGLSTAESR